jgi:predicted nucleic acid-binding protein
VLIDTNVWSELSRPRPDARVSQWMRKHFDACVLSALVLAEIQYGIALVKGARRRELQSFLDELMVRLEGKVAAFDAAAAAAWGPLRARLKVSGELFGERDMLVAAQALSLAIPIVTRNVSEMARSGATIVNPWEA